MSDHSVESDEFHDDNYDAFEMLKITTSTIEILKSVDNLTTSYKRQIAAQTMRLFLQCHERQQEEEELEDEEALCDTCHAEQEEDEKVYCENCNAELEDDGLVLTDVIKEQIDGTPSPRLIKKIAKRWKKAYYSNYGEKPQKTVDEETGKTVNFYSVEDAEFLVPIAIEECKNYQVEVKEEKREDSEKSE